MANVLNEEKKQQVLALGRLGWSLRRIQQATHVRRETAGAYLKAAGIAVRPPSGWGRCEPKPANEVITDSGAAKPAIPVIPDPLDPNCNPNPENLSTKGRAKATSKPANENEVITDSAVVAGPSACEPYREVIDLGINRGRNAMAIWQDLVSEYGFASSYQSVQRFVRKRRGTQTPEARVVIVTAAGQEAQVDYGTGPMVRDPESRKYRRTRLFVMTLGCSRKSVRLLTFRSSSRIWAELHERAFRRLGGATRIVVLDNLREGVLVPDIYDPTLNPLYRDVLAHYGAVAMPCRIQDPDRKGKVESGVGHAQKTPLKGLHFETLEEAQAYLDRWEQRWADTRIHGTTKRQVAAMFAEERPTLLTEPLAPIDLLSCLVSDELARRGERLLERRTKQAQFRDAHKTLDNFDFAFNKKMNRSLVFDLAAGAFIARHEDALFLGPPGTGKSHLAQAIGHAAIQQGYRVLYRETHALLDDLAEATLDGTRKEHMEFLVTVPLLILDDLGMRKLPLTAAEELLEIIMRRYERASTMLTSNRPVEDWGKLMGDAAAVSAMLDRLLHHGHVLKCGPRSWRTKTDLPPQEAAG